MFLFEPPHADILLVTDTRTLADHKRDIKEKPSLGRHNVMPTWAFGKAVWGYNWDKQVARLALFDFGAKVTPAMRKAAKEGLNSFLASRKDRYKYILVLQSRSKRAKKAYNDDYTKSSHTGTICWDFFNPPANIASMVGTFWERAGQIILPLQNPQNMDYVYGAMVIRWLTAVRDGVTPIHPSEATTFTESTDGLVWGLSRLLESAQTGKPIAIDIESFSTQDLITVIGLSDGVHTCAVPWETFRPHGAEEDEPGLCEEYEGDLVRRVLMTAKGIIGHNIIRFDIPYMARKGVKVAGETFDTYLAHGVLYNQCRHGLQQAVSYEFPVPPWKTWHTHSVTAAGLDKEDPEAWIQNPTELRKYNARDVYYNYIMGMALLEKVPR